MFVKAATQKWKQILLALIGASWTVLLVFWPRSSNIILETDQQQQTTISGEGLYKSTLTTANFGLLGVRFYETNQGRKRWNIRSKFAELHRKNNYAYLKEVDADFYSEKNDNVVNTLSQYGRSYLEKSLVELEGDVQLHSRRGYLFTMEQLNYDGNSHEFTSEVMVHMKGPKVEQPTMFLQGVGLSADLDREHFILKKNVSSQKKLKNSNWMKVTSKSGEFFTSDSRAIFIGKAHAMLPNMSINSDLFEISVAAEKELLLARGNVVLKHKDRVGNAQSALIEVGSNRIVLEGRASIDSKGNRIKGTRITMFTDEDRLEVREAEGRIKN